VEEQEVHQEESDDQRNGECVLHLSPFFAPGFRCDHSANIGSAASGDEGSRVVFTGA
jgi:hypothetical protein